MKFYLIVAKGKKKGAAEAEATRLADEQAEAEIAAQMAKEEAQDIASVVTVVAEPVKPTGASVTECVDFEVTNIDALYKWDDERRIAAFARDGRILQSVIKLEVRRREFKELINTLPKEQRDQIPGVKFTEETKVAVRSANLGGFLT